MKFIKKNRSILIILSVIIVILLITFFALYNFLFSGYNSSPWGNRLDGIEEVPISEETINSGKKIFTDIDGVQNVTYSLSGKRCNFIITVSKDTKYENIIKLEDKFLELFTDEQKNFYDFQIYIDINEESDIYPIIGYKKNTSIKKDEATGEMITLNESFTWLIGKEEQNEE
ncbi:MAG: hypothetical protein NC181_02775 [Clostridium sp.]|nr:hypothetical protein [Clostridium sp.]MCM1444114.1 hypothetical protein [Candidatus Amulumruptor caecigallinarius]